jgi:hypothetical protein
MHSAMAGSRAATSEPMGPVGTPSQPSSTRCASTTICAVPMHVVNPTRETYRNNHGQQGWSWLLVVCLRRLGGEFVQGTYLKGQPQQALHEVQGVGRPHTPQHVCDPEQDHRDVLGALQGAQGIELGSGVGGHEHVAHPTILFDLNGGTHTHTHKAPVLFQ